MAAGGDVGRRGTSGTGADASSGPLGALGGKGVGSLLWMRHIATLFEKGWYLQ